jgi:hypothetical protein
VGLARLETGLDLHRAPQPVSTGTPGELWVHRLSEAPDAQHLGDKGARLSMPPR